MSPLPPVARFHEAVLIGLRRWVPAVVSDAVGTLALQAAEDPSPLQRAQATEAHFRLRGVASRLAEGYGQRLHSALQAAAAGSATGAAGGLAAAGATPQPDAARSAFVLIAEDQIDEDIEVARIAQLIEAEAEQELRQLAPLCSGLRRMDAVRFDAIALQPVVCARALRSSLSEMAFDPAVRLLCLQHLGRALCRHLRQVFREQVAELAGWGIEPARYLIRQTAGGDTRATPAQAQPPAGAGAVRAQATAGAAPSAQRKTRLAAAAGVPHSETLAALGRLVEWAQRQVPAEAANPARAAPSVDATEAQLLTFRLDALASAARPGGAPVAPPTLDPARAAQVMACLFQQIEKQAAWPPAFAALMHRLRGAAPRLQMEQGDLWQSVDHPWWQLLDRVMALGVTLDDPAPGEGDLVTAALAQAVARLENAPSIERALCSEAVAEIDEAAARWVQQRGQQIDTEFLAVEGDLQRRETESAIRLQAAADLRVQPVPQALHRFLVGPWAQAMTETALKFGADSSELLAQARLFEQMQAAGREPVTREQRRWLIAQVRPVLLQAGLTSERVECELQDLAAVLRRPPPVQEQAPEQIQAAEEAVAFALGLSSATAHGEYLSTVPIDMLETEGPTPATRHCEAWLDEMAPGMRFHMFLQDRWMTTQLTWASPNRQLFVFNSRHGGRVHSMTRRVLTKLRLAGLAATLTNGQLLAEAMDNLSGLADLPDATAGSPVPTGAPSKAQARR